MHSDVMNKFHICMLSNGDIMLTLFNNNKWEKDKDTTELRKLLFSFGYEDVVAISLVEKLITICLVPFSQKNFTIFSSTASFLWLRLRFFCLCWHICFKIISSISISLYGCCFVILSMKFLQVKPPQQRENYFFFFYIFTTTVWLAMYLRYITNDTINW